MTCIAKVIDYLVILLRHIFFLIAIELPKQFTSRTMSGIGTLFLEAVGATCLTSGLFMPTL